MKHHAVSDRPQPHFVCLCVREPDGPREALRLEALACQAQAMLLEAQARDLAARFASANIRVIVLKGPVLAQTVYRTPGLRPYSDIDLTVQEKDESAAATVLVECGFSEAPYEASIAQRAHAEHTEDGLSFHRLFAGVGDRVLVELHTDPLQLGLRPELEHERWSRALATPGLSGALMLAPEDQVVQLSVHALKHGYSRLIWLKDLDLLLRSYHETLDWNRIQELARVEGVTASVWYTLQLTPALLDTPLPPASAGLKPRLVTRFLYSRLWPQARITALEGFLRRRTVQFHAAESWRGILPSLVLMGRRRTRLRLLLQTLRA